MPAAIGAGLISYCTTNASVVSPKYQPALNAVMLASRMSAALAKRRSRNAIVDSVGRPYIHDSRPSANMFFARLASLRDSPNSLTASTVMSGELEGVHVVLGERVVLERVLGVAGLVQVAGR